MLMTEATKKRVKQGDEDEKVGRKKANEGGKKESKKVKKKEIDK